MVEEAHITEDRRQQIPEGYQLTEVGVIPEDWEVVRIDDITTKVGSGITPTGGSSVYTNQGRPFIRSQNIGWGKLLLNDIAHISEGTHNQFLGTEIIIDDVLLNITGASIGRCAIADHNIVGGNVNQHVCIIRSVEGISPHILLYYILSDSVQKQIDNYQAGGNREGLNFNQIRSFQIPLPPTLAEQQAIAKALSDMDALIEGLERLVEKKRQIKQGAMWELLTGRRRIAGFGEGVGYQDTEVGRIPEDWEVVTYGEAFDLLSTAAYSRAELSKNETVGYVHYGDIHTKWNHFLDVEKAHLPTIKNTQLKSYSLVQEGDLIMADASEDYLGIGESVEVVNLGNRKVISGLHTFLLRDRKGYFVNGFKAYIHANKMVKTQMDRLATGLKVYGVSRANLKVIKIPTPPKEEQIAIASTLRAMDTELVKLQSQLTKHHQLKRGMMQELLTGKKRLV